MTKLVIFGASGRTGIHLVQQALDAGHSVVASVRNPDKLPIRHERLTPVQGDVMNAGDVDRAVGAGVDAVLCALSPGKDSPPDLLTQAAGHILASMQQHGVARIVYMTGAGVPAPEDRPKLLNHVIKFLLKTISGDVLKQSEAAVDQVRASDRAWTIVRVPLLTDDAASGQIRVGWVGVNTGARIARADAATFILQQVDAGEHLHRAPMISN